MTWTPNEEKDKIAIQSLIEKEQEEEYNDPDYQFYITMRAPKK